MPFDVYEENWNAVQLFLALQTQWRIALGQGVVVYQGINYRAASDFVLVSLGLQDPESWPLLFAGLRLMEIAALKVLNSDDDGD